MDWKQWCEYGRCSIYLELHNNRPLRAVVLIFSFKWPINNLLLKSQVTSVLLNKLALENENSGRMEEPLTILMIITVTQFFSNQKHLVRTLAKTSLVSLPI